MDEATLELLKQSLPLIKQMHDAITGYPIYPYVYGPVCGVVVVAAGGFWRYYIKVVDGFVARQDASAERERAGYENRITSNETQFERMADLAQAIKDNTDAVKAMNGD